eukprot:12887242-Prorocentrum_lima.AAC.1
MPPRHGSTKRRVLRPQQAPLTGALTRTKEEGGNGGGVCGPNLLGQRLLPWLRQQARSASFA